MSIFKNAKTAIKFKGGSYQKRADGPIITFNDVSLDTALISITKVKKLIRSEVAGKDGDVIEYIGKGSDEITIVGTITGDAYHRPTSLADFAKEVVDAYTGALNGEPREAVNALNALIDAPIAIDVVCPFLNLKGIFKIVITDANLPQDAGGINYQTFTINAISEQPIELRILNV